jgi:hypothetical protein
MFGFKGLNKSLITSGLVLYMDASNRQSFEPGTTNVYDLAKVAQRADNQAIFNGTLVNGVGWSSDYGGIFTFDGIDDYIQINQINLDFPYKTLAAVREQTCSVWIRQRGGVTAYFCMGDSRNDVHRTCYLYGDNVSGTGVRYLIGNDATSNSIFVSGASMPGLNVWFNLTCTYDLQTMKMYINGDFLTNTSTSIIPYVGDSSNYNLYARIGERTRNSTVKFEGDIASWALYNRALTANEVQQNFEALRGRFGI